MQGQSQIPGLGICTVEITTTTIAETAENMPFNVFHDITGLTQGLGFSWVELTYGVYWTRNKVDNSNIATTDDWSVLIHSMGIPGTGVISQGTYTLTDHLDWLSLIGLINGYYTSTDGVTMRKYVFRWYPISDTIAPTPPTNLTYLEANSYNVTLSWSAATDNLAVTSYNIYKGGQLWVANITALTSLTTITVKVFGLAPSTNYTFTVKAKDAANNISIDSNSLSVSTATLSSESFKYNPLSIYPNPTKNLLHINLENELSGKITDLTGKTLMTVSTKDIDISSLSAGIYLLDIISEEKHYVSKIVKE